MRPQAAKRLCVGWGMAQGRPRPSAHAARHSGTHLGHLTGHITIHDTKSQAQLYRSGKSLRAQARRAQMHRQKVGHAKCRRPVTLDRCHPITHHPKQSLKCKTLLLRRSPDGACDGLYERKLRVYGCSLYTQHRLQRSAQYKLQCTQDTN